jgi:hypothetical protein
MGGISGKDLAYRVLASAVGGPVDLTAMALRPFGYNVEKSVLGSEWIGQKMEQVGLVSDARDPLKEFVASVMTPSPGGLATGLAKGSALVPAIAGMVNSGKVADVFKNFTPISKATVLSRSDLQHVDKLSKVAPVENLPQLGTKVFGNTDPYVYHGTSGASLDDIVNGGLKASKGGYEGPGVYFATRPEKVLDYVDSGSQIYRVKKQDLEKTYGLYNSKSNTTGRVMFGEDVVVESKSVPPGFIEVLTDGGWKPILSKSSQPQPQPKPTFGERLKAPAPWPSGYSPRDPVSTRLSLQEVVPTQSSVDNKIVNKYISGRGDFQGAPVEVVLDQVSGKYLIIDGHHRAAAQFNTGSSTIPASIVGIK